MTKKSADINYISKDLFPKTYNRTMIDDDYIKQLEQENKQLKDNWNKLRESIETDNKRAKGYIERIITSDLCHGDYPVEYYYAEKRKEITDYYLDKMNKLEGKDK